jgi:hypothetical protein
MLLDGDDLYPKNRLHFPMCSIHNQDFSTLPNTPSHRLQNRVCQQYGQSDQIRDRSKVRVGERERFCDILSEGNRHSEIHKLQTAASSGNSDKDDQ